ncbi:hypothetical protein LP52_21445 [Streptomonospora alba]|uniref:Uncharacterized protein n=1 Tax=Streptomonospora alba TaxID=183763 RepID=A0A0C2JJF2_9ACTN|nr:hypothetical protein [Streptomonospora alba]KIH97017.1 hypothetical protein LP52_21445 [Streptomonospora alba]
MKRRELSHTEQLRQALSEREAQLQEAKARLAAVEGSTSLQVGRALTAAAKRPGRGLVRLPRDLFRLWRRAGRTQPATGRGRKTQPVRSFDAEREEARLLSGGVGVRDSRLVVAGILAPEVHAALAPYVRVVPLRPQDAQAAFESVDVDVVCVSASAAAPGSLWAHAGDPAVSDRTRVLNWVIESASARGVPTVLIADAPAPPGLAALEFDHVHRGDTGVPLHRFNPVAAEPERDPEPAYVPSPAPAGVVADRLVERLAEDGMRRLAGVREDPEELPARLRASSGVVVDDTALADRALACGARALLLGGGSRGESDERDAAVRTVAADVRALRSSAAIEELARLREAGPLTSEELRLVLRSVFLTDATPVRLAEIFGRLGFAPGSGSPSLPLKSRQTALLALPGDDAESLALAGDVLQQSYAPDEVVVPESAVHLAGIERLRSHGVPVRTAAGAAPEGAPQPEDWARLARAAAAPWAALWSGPRGEHFLADLLCAAECSGADAVGPAVPDGHSQRRPIGDSADAVGHAAAEQEYVFVGSIVPELARRELLCRALQPGVWNRHGARLLALGPLLGTGESRSERARTTPGTG